MKPSRTYLGIDFSGDHAKWTAGARARSNVWIAEAVHASGGLRLVRLDRVQGRYPMAARPFEALADELASCRHEVAAIDAPFAVPAAQTPEGRHAALLSLVKAVARDAARSFPRGGDFRAAVVAATSEPEVAKPLRATERHWVERGVNTRSTLWAGARGGAPMTAACLELLARCRAPLWPWTTEASGLLAEAFPAAQLRTWGLPFVRYDASKDADGAAANRRAIVEGLASRIDLGPHRATMLASADALDAVVAVFGGLAVREGALAHQLTTDARLEGHIAVHR
jgi:hypothetical protein